MELREILNEVLLLIMGGLVAGVTFTLMPLEALTRTTPVGPPLTFKENLIRGLVMSVIASLTLLAGGMIVLLYPYAREVFAEILVALGLRLTELFISLGVMVLGVGAYVFKVKRQSAYGIVEIVFAGIASVVAARQLSTTTAAAASLATMAGSIYVVSRGMSNYFEGKKKSAN